MVEFRNSDQVKYFLKNEAKRLNISVSNAYNTYISRTFLQRLSENNDETFIVKGSSAEIAYLGSPVRAITDIDIATLYNLKESMPTISTALYKHNLDVFDFELAQGIRKTKTGIYQFSLNANYGTIKHPLGMDVEENYSRLIEASHVVMPAIFEGDTPFEIFAPSFEEYLAEKLCIIVESNKAHVLNTRVKDFYDIYQLHGGKYDPDKLTDYFSKMLKSRGKIAIEKAKTNNLNEKFITDHSDVWESTKRRYDYLDKEIDLAGAVYYTRAVLREQLQKNGMEMPVTAHHVAAPKLLKINQRKLT